MVTCCRLGVGPVWLRIRERLSADSEESLSQLPSRRHTFSYLLGFINPRRAYIIVVLVAIITAAAMSYGIISR